MIIMRLVGGLGNQLFQYATGRALAIEGGAELKLDVTGYLSDPKRSFRLRSFFVESPIARDDEIAAVRGVPQERLARFIFRVQQRLRPHYRRRTIVQRSRYFDPNLLRVTGPAYLIGYWQSERYFRHIKELLCHELRLRQPVSAESRALAREMRQTASVSVHVRRGDYVAEAKTAQVHGAQPVEYYKAAAIRLRKQLSAPNYYVFSDETEWTKANLHFEGPTVHVVHNGPDRPEEDLWLMSQCRHHIIANSSFSWWGAWLNPDPEKLVIAPRRWFRDPAMDEGDIVPVGWQRV